MIETPLDISDAWRQKLPRPSLIYRLLFLFERNAPRRAACRGAEAQCTVGARRAADLQTAKTVPPLQARGKPSGLWRKLL
jgi:hypothetical protein